MALTVSPSVLRKTETSNVLSVSNVPAEGLKEMVAA